jgi:hypothetical protein
MLPRLRPRGCGVNVAIRSGANVAGSYHWSGTGWTAAQQPAQPSWPPPMSAPMCAPGLARSSARVGVSAQPVVIERLRNGGCSTATHVRDQHVDELTRRIDKLQEAITSVLPADLQQTLALTIANLRGVADRLQRSIDSMRVGLTNFQEVLTADLTAGIAGMGETVERLVAGLASVAASA